MSEPTALLTTIDDYLLSLADGIALAQRELGKAAASGPPGRQFSYYLPELDFELRMRIQITQDEELSQRYESVRAPEVRDKHLLFSPVATSTTTNTQTEVLSIIKGRFVAVPANDGLPPTLVRTTLETDGQGSRTLVVRTESAARQALAGVDIEVNLDREASDALSAEHGVTGIDWSGTWLGAGLLQTDAAGVARVEVHLDPALPVDTQVVLTVDAAGQTELFVVPVR